MHGTLAPIDILKGVLDSSLNGVTVYQSIRNEEGQIVDFQITLLNAIAEKDLGTSADELIGRRLSEFQLDASQIKLINQYKKVIETGQPYRLELQYTLPTRSEPAWLDVSVVKLEDSVVVSYSDISTIKKSEFALGRQADLVSNVLKTTQTGIMLLTTIRDEQGKIVDFRIEMTNEKNSELRGFSPTEMLGKTVLSIDPNARINFLFDTWVQVVESGQPIHIEHYYKPNQIWLDVAITKFGDGALVSIYDITSFKNAHLARQQQAELLQRVTDTSLSALACCEAIRDEKNRLINMRVTMVNQVTAEWLNKPIDQILHQTILQLFPMLIQVDALERLENLIEDGHPYGLEYTMGDRWYSLALARFGDGVVISASDITALRQYQQNLEHYNKELKRSNGDLQQFAYVASHDLQEPLRKIQSFGEILENQITGHVSDGQLALLQRMQDAARRMQVLIQDLLTYSRVSSKRDLAERISLSDVVQEVLMDLEVTILDKKAEIQSDPLPTIRGDRLQLRQLFQNLISNALKFNQPNVQPLVRVACRSVSGQIIPEASPSEQNQPFHEISVVDNGIGFDEKYLDRIFQVFQRLHNRSEYSGTGIGLAICKKVVENHKGHITASSQPGEGATFRIYLPV